jgi:hypothetical protein
LNAICPRTEGNIVHALSIKLDLSHANDQIHFEAINGTNAFVSVFSWSPTSFDRQSRRATMVVMKYFCFYFPVRSGVLITSSLSILQSVTLLSYCVINTEKDLRKKCENVRENIEDYSSNQVFDSILDFAIQREHFCLFS